MAKLINILPLFNQGLNLIINDNSKKKLLFMRRIT